MLNRKEVQPSVILLLILLLPYQTQSQVSGNTLIGDVNVEQKESNEMAPTSLRIALYTLSGRLISRQTVAPGGRYRFMDIRNGEYDLVVEFDHQEVARTRVRVFSARPGDLVQEDIHLELKSISNLKSRPGVITAEDYYERSEINKRRFEKARSAANNKQYEDAIFLLNALLSEDPSDYQAWTELGTSYLAGNKTSEAEAAYLRASNVRPTYLQALLNLGRVYLSQQQYEKAIQHLTEAVKHHPLSSAVNYYLGEAYLQVKKGSIAVTYLKEAIRLDPDGMAEAHLRLAALYHGAGFKDRAVVEYEEFLRRRPNHDNKKEIEKYIRENKGRKTGS